MSEGSKSIIVTVADHMLGDINQVAKKLAARGMKINQVMPITGVIAGSCSPAKMSALEQVDGVASVEEEASATLPPSDAAVQ